jgi:ribosome-binding protein aMBF1 (putative translation factor)
VELGEEILVPESRWRGEERRLVRRRLAIRPEFKEREIIPDISIKLREAREKMGLKQEEAAKRIGIQSSILKRIESQNFRPDNNILRKIERFFKIRLTKEKEE